MPLTFTTRASDLPWVNAVWTCTSDAVAEMTSVATARWGLVFWEQDGTRGAAITGPETATATAPVPEGASFTGIELEIGTFLRGLPPSRLVDAGSPLTVLPDRRFRLHGQDWELPGPDDAEALVGRLVAAGLLGHDPVVSDLVGEGVSLTTRTVQRRFRAATGLTAGAVRQTERARRAAVRLAGGAHPASVVHDLGFYDEPHLARALRRYVGRTATELRSGSGGALALDLTQASTS